jgi:hypothetical protein
MKISKKDFDRMKAKYHKEVKQGKPGKNKKHEIDHQTNWVAYTKEDLMEVLNKDGVTGLKFHFVEYPEDVAEEFYGKDAHLYVGRLGLVYSPIYDSAGDTRSAKLAGDEDEYYDRGATCPPRCESEDS